MPNGPQTPSRTHGTPAYPQPIYNDWAWYVACEQRRLIIRTVSRGSAVPNPQELAVIIRKHLESKRAAIRELIESAEAVAASMPDPRLIAALEASRWHFGKDVR